MSNDLKQGRPGDEKEFAFTSAERGYIVRLTELATVAQAQIAAVNGEMSLVVAEARQRLGLPPEARIVPDLKRGTFVLLAPETSGEQPAPKVVELPRTRAGAN